MTVNATANCHSLYRRTVTAELPVSNSSHVTVNAAAKCRSIYRRTVTAELPVSNSSHVTVNATAKRHSVYRRTLTAELPVESSSAPSHLSFRPSSSGPPRLEAEESASPPLDPQ